MRQPEIAAWISAVATVISLLVSIVALYNSNAAVSKVDQLQTSVDARISMSGGGGGGALDGGGGGGAGGPRVDQEAMEVTGVLLPISEVACPKGSLFQLVRIVNSYRGPPATLGSVAASGTRMVVWCKGCGYQSEPDPAEQARWYGPETTVPEWARRLVCSKCGSRDIDFVLTGARW